VPDIFKKDPDPETNKITSIQNEQKMLPEPKITKTTEQIAYPQFEEINFQQSQPIEFPQFEESPNASEVLDLLESLEIMRTEEQRLIELKKQILAKQHDLESKLIKKIETKKIAIANLISEIPSLQDRCKQLGQALGADIYN